MEEDWEILSDLESVGNSDTEYVLIDTATVPIDLPPANALVLQQCDSSIELNEAQKLQAQFPDGSSSPSSNLTGFRVATSWGNQIQLPSAGPAFLLAKRPSIVSHQTSVVVGGCIGIELCGKAAPQLAKGIYLGSSVCIPTPDSIISAIPLSLIGRGGSQIAGKSGHIIQERQSHQVCGKVGGQHVKQPSGSEVRVTFHQHGKHS